jgi:glycerol-1-phosphatase
MSPPQDSAPKVPARDFDVALYDLDGVIYVGPYAVSHAAQSLRRARELGQQAAFVTNNASRAPQEVAEHLVELGIEATASEVVTSAQAGARLVRNILGPGSHRVLAIGGPGVGLALASMGLRPVTSVDDSPVAVMQGFGKNIGWAELAQACSAVERGLPWIATNPDTSIPTPHGRAPGNGAFIAAVSLVTGRHPDVVAGKPYPALMQESLDRTGAQRPLMVGDRLDTDIEAAVNLSMPSLLVMTGVTDVADVLTASPAQRPMFIGPDLRALLVDHPPVLQRGGVWTCGSASARWEDYLQLAGPMNSVEEWSCSARAAAVAAWSRAATLDMVTTAVEPLAEALIPLLNSGGPTR